MTLFSAFSPSLRGSALNGGISTRKPQCYHFAVGSAGYVLVGGRSSRMGRDKALLPFRGGALAQSVAQAVREATGAVTLVGDPARYAGLGYPVIPDLYPGEGPLGGILTALRNSSADWNLIAACDMPQLDPELLRGLLKTAAESGANALLPVGPDGRPEPLCALYHRRCLDPMGAAFAVGIRKVTAALETVRTVRLPMAEVSLFQNVNTPEEWAGHAAG
jgi:molybdopterin-guanine dinucleotide biosynthesis protein A